MNPIVQMLQSLGLYLLGAKGGGKTLVDCRSAADYHDFLMPFVEQATNLANMFGFNSEHPLMPLDEITLTFNDYCAIANQIYAGVTQLNALYLPYPKSAATEAAEKATKEAHTSYFQNYLGTKSLQGDTRTPLDVTATMERINSILMKHPDGRARGLVVGRVQSGKTRNYIGLMLKAIDEGWNVIIVLTSCNTALADQTEERIKKDFRECGIRQRFYKWQSFRNPQPLEEPDSLEDGNYPYVGVAMKQVDNLDRIIEWFKAYPEHLPQMRVLLIDDESDNATPDSNQANDRRLTEEDMDELVASIEDAASNEDPIFKELADWIDLIRSDGEFSDEDGTPDAKIVKALKKTLSQKTKATFPEVLANEEYKRVLGLEQYQVDGRTIDVPNLIRRYFNGTGRSHRAPSYFIQFLKGLLDVAASRSAINRRICTIVGKVEQTGEYNFDFGHLAYVAYTATPYANMFNERSDQTPLYPDFIYSLHEAPQYFGLDKIFGEDVTTDSTRMDIVQLIPTCDGDNPPSEEVRFILRPLQQIVDPSITPRAVLPIQGPDTDLHVICHEEQANYDGEWNTLKEALAWFFCSAAARRWHRKMRYAPAVEQEEGLTEAERTKKINDLDRRWTTMLVNISQKRNIHRLSKQIIEAYLKKMCAPEQRDAFVNYCRTCWDKMCSKFDKSGFDALFNTGTNSDKYGEIDNYPSWDEIVEHLLYFICGLDDATVHLVVINSENVNSRQCQDRYYQRRDTRNRWDFSRDSLTEDHAWIVCGGNTISRGLTMPGLTTSYFDRVRGSAAVDTLTQMGRWFGFRPGYELYPRLWMTSETVREMKNICATENFMHETMRENFDAGVSPSDPDHYQQVYYWGRKLSGRQRQLDIKTAVLGTTATTDDISIGPEDVHGIYEAAKAFIAGLGPAKPRPSADYSYGEMPLWQDVHWTEILNFLNSIKNRYPNRSKRKIESLVREIENSDLTNWDIVIGEPVERQGGRHYFVSDTICSHAGIDGGMVKTGQPKPLLGNGELRYTKVRSDMAFYAMINRRQIALTDHWVLKETRTDVLKELRTYKKTNGGRLPDQFEEAFESVAATGNDLGERLDAYIAYCELNPEFAIAPCIRACFEEGFRNRSSVDYCERVHSIAQHKRPILQLYFLTPPEGIPQDLPLVSVSFYWPQHKPGPFQIGTVLTPPPPPHPTSAQVGRAIGDILRNNHFPMQANALKDALLQRYPSENESLYNTNVVGGQEIGGYREFPQRRAYYSLDWAGEEDPVELIDKVLLEAVLEILRRDRAKHTTHDLVNELKKEKRFIGIADLSPTHINDLLTMEVLQRNGILYTDRPKTYRAI